MKTIEPDVYLPIIIMLIITYASIDIYVPVVNYIAAYFKVSIVNAKQFNSFYVTGIFIPILFFSLFIDRLNKFQLIKYATYSYSFVSFCIVFVKESFFLACILRLLQGNFASMIMTISIPLILEIYQEHQAIKKLGTINAWITLALVSAPALSIGLISYSDLRIINCFIFLTSLTAAFLLMKNHDIACVKNQGSYPLGSYLKLLNNKRFMNLTMMYALSHGLLLIYVFTSPFLNDISTDYFQNSTIYQTLIMLSFVAGNIILNKLAKKHSLKKLFHEFLGIIIAILTLIGLSFFFQKNLFIMKLLICCYAFCFALFTNLLVIERAKAFASLNKNAFVYTIGIFFRFLFGSILVLLYSLNTNMFTTAEFLILISTGFAIILSINLTLERHFATGLP